MTLDFGNCGIFILWVMQNLYHQPYFNISSLLGQQPSAQKWRTSAGLMPLQTCKDVLPLAIEFLHRSENSFNRKENVEDVLPILIRLHWRLTMGDFEVIEQHGDQGISKFLHRAETGRVPC